MTGADGTYDYKAMAAGIVLAGGEGMGNLLPVVEKELLHYRILDAMMREGFFSSLVFQGGTSLRLCHGSPRYSEDLDFAGGTSFDMDTLKGLGSCISDSLSGMGDDVTVRVKEPRPDADGLTRRWRIAIRTAGQRKDLPSQTIKLEVASIPAYEPQHRPALVNYPMFPALSGQIILDVESPTEILADKLLSYACASHLRRRDLWDMCWLASRGDVDSRRAMELAELKSSDYGEEGLWADRADRVAGVADVIGSLRRRDAPVPPRRPDDIHGRIPTLERMGDRTDRDVVRHSRHSIVGRCGSRIPYFRCVERLQSNPLNAKEVCDVESGL